jgi:hypothetical protein
MFPHLAQQQPRLDRTVPLTILAGAFRLMILPLWAWLSSCQMRLMLMSSGRTCVKEGIQCRRWVLAGVPEDKMWLRLTSL